MDRGYRVVEYLQSRIIKRNTCTQNLDNIERTPALNFSIFLRDNHILSKSWEQLKIVQCTGTHQTPVTGDFFFRSGIVGIAVGQQRFILAFGAHGDEGRSESLRQIGNTGFSPFSNTIRLFYFVVWRTRQLVLLVDRFSRPSLAQHFAC